MAGKKLPYDGAGGVIRMQRRLFKSEVYLKLPPQEKALIQLLQVHWYPDRPIAFGVREAEQLIPCSRQLAMRAFRWLQDDGFIVMVDESVFCSRTQSKSRTWRLTWMPWNYGFPTNDWEESA